jgi:hypothetical protein
MNVVSNDDLYGGAPGYISELKEQIETIIEEIMKQLKLLGENSDAFSKVTQVLRPLYA